MEIAFQQYRQIARYSSTSGFPLFSLASGGELVSLATGRGCDGIPRARSISRVISLLPADFGAPALHFGTKPCSRIFSTSPPIAAHRLAAAPEWSPCCLPSPRITSPLPPLAAHRLRAASHCLPATSPRPHPLAMSNPLRQGSRVNEPPRLRPQFVVPRFGGGQGSQSNGGGDPTRTDLMRQRVVATPPAGFVCPLSQASVDDLPYVNIEESPGGMDSGSYFSNLLSNELNYPFVYGPDTAAAISDDTPPLEETATQEDVPAVMKEKKKGKNFSVDEDNLLCSAWLNVCMDPIQGVDQPKSKYWQRIHEYFHAHKKFESDRSEVSLMNRWSGIRRDVNMFVGCVSKIEARNQSGCTYDDKVASACAAFKQLDKLHRNFPYMHCWKILKDKPKWIERRKHMNTPTPAAKKQKTTADSSPASAPLLTTGGNGDHGQATEGNATERPAGKKKEKERLRQRSSMQAMELFVEKKKEADVQKELKKEERWKKTVEVLEERNRIERERVELKRAADEERIMNIDMNSLSYKQQQFYERRQDEILARHRNN